MKLSVTISGKPTEAHPYAVNGLGLQCATDSGQVFILEHMALDREAFWEAWRKLGGESQGLQFEGGEPYQPPFLGNCGVQDSPQEPGGPEYSI